MQLVFRKFIIKLFKSFYQQFLIFRVFQTSYGYHLLFPFPAAHFRQPLTVHRVGNYNGFLFQISRKAFRRFLCLAYQYLRKAVKEIPVRFMIAGIGVGALRNKHIPGKPYGRQHYETRADGTEGINQASLFLFKIFPHIFQPFQTDAQAAG